MKTNRLDEDEILLNNETGLAGLVIDMQRLFLKQIEEKEREGMIKSQITLIHRLFEVEAPIFFIEYTGFGKTIKELTKEISRKRGNRIEKSSDDGFKETNLDYELKKYHAEHIILMGVNATFCVKETATSALMKGYHIYTARELIAGKKEFNGREMDCAIKRWYSDKGEYFKTEEQLWRYLSKNLGA